MCVCCMQYGMPKGTCWAKVSSSEKIKPTALVIIKIRLVLDNTSVSQSVEKSTKLILCQHFGPQ